MGPQSIDRLSRADRFNRQTVHNCDCATSLPGSSFPDSCPRAADAL